MNELMVRAFKKAKESPDPSTQNSALIVYDGKVLAEDVNRFPKGVEYTDERWERPLKYKIIEHAERNVIYQCAKAGIITYGRDMISPWAACSDCARAIIEAGIKRLITFKPARDKSPDFWLEEIHIADTMLAEAGVELVLLDCHIGVEIRHSGELWRP